MGPYFLKGLVLEQFQKATADKPLRKLLSEEDAANGNICFPPKDDTSLSSVTKQEIIQASRSAGIWEKHAGRPLTEVLGYFAKQPMKLLVLEAVDDEPYVTSSLILALKKQKSILAMAEALKNVFSVPKVELAVYAKYCNPQIDLSKEQDVKIHPVRMKYPAQRRLELLFGHPEEGVCILNVESLVHLYRSLIKGRPQSSVFLTVAGSAVGSPCNMEVSLGSSFSAVLGLCSLTCNPAVVVRGGSMSGISVGSLDEKVQPSDRAIFAFEEPVRKQQLECIGCARCARVCPQGLVPSYLYRCAANKTFDACEYLLVNDCMECGCCSYICPSNVDLLSYIRRAKEHLKSRGERSGSNIPLEPEIQTKPESDPVE